MACNEKRFVYKFVYNFDVVPKSEYSDVKIPPDKTPVNEVKRLCKPIDWDKPISIEYKGEIYPAKVLGVIHQRSQRYTVYIVRPEDESFKELFFQRDGRFIGWFMTHHDEAMVKFRPSEDIAIEELPVVVQEEPAVTPFDFRGVFRLVFNDDRVFSSINFNKNNGCRASGVATILCKLGAGKARKIVHIVNLLDYTVPDFFFDDYGRCLGFFDSLIEKSSGIEFVSLNLARLERYQVQP